MTTNLLVGSDNTIELASLADGITGVAISDATCVCTLLNRGTIVAGASSLAMAYVTADAAYRATVIETVPLVYGNTYVARITVTQGSTVATIDTDCPTVTS